ncbi:hypothetical protein PG985_003761 [Apiospora marii]|uniref:uncharacterized protein n=1 Tax=Apiospora marii TaxID=335849 RepID=UPI00312CE7E6
MATFPIERDDQRAILAANVLMIAVPVVAVSLRLLSRRIAKRAFDISDYLMVAAVVCKLCPPFLVDALLASHDEIKDQFTWVISLSLCKISILILYRRLFPTPLIHWASLATSALIASWAIATIVAGCLICQPISKNWDLNMTGGHCGDQVLSFTVTGVINLITDVMVLVLPLRHLYKLQVPTQQRVVLVGVFSLGFLTCAVSAVRIHYLKSMDYTDLTFSMKYPNIFSGLEPSAAITLACIPLLRPLFRWTGGYSSTGTALHHEPKSSSTKHSENSHRTKDGVSDNVALERFDTHNNGGEDGSSQRRLRPEDVRHTAMATGHPRHGGSDGGSSLVAESLVEEEDGEEKGEEDGVQRRSGNHRLDRPGIMVRQQWDVTKQ